MFDAQRISANSPLRVKPSTSKSNLCCQRIADAVIRTNNAADESTYNTSIFKRGIMFESSQKLTDSVRFVKFVHTSLPFCSILNDDQSQSQLAELDIAWRNDDGTKINVADSLFDDDDVEHRFIPMPAQPQDAQHAQHGQQPQHANTRPAMRYDDARSTMSPQIDNTLFSVKSTRNKHINPKPRSLLRPTQIKDYKLVNND